MRERYEPLAEIYQVKGASECALGVGASDTGSPAFFAWAGADLMSAPLQCIQVVKGWIDEAGQTHESVRDIACADDLAVDPMTGRCPDNGATVDLSDCSVDTSTGARELAVVWRDPGYVPGQNAFYYTRVLQNPTCRWSTYDSLRLGIEPPAQVPATIRERAWSSPIWLQHAAATAQESEPLDLSLPADLLGGQDLVTTPGQERLPNLFNQQQKKKSALKGKLLLEEDGPIDPTMLKGAELQVDIPIN